METTDPQGIWLMIEEPVEQTSAESNQHPETDSSYDSYEYFPDFGI